MTTAERTLAAAMRAGAWAAVKGDPAESNPHLDWRLAAAWCWGWHAGHREWRTKLPEAIAVQAHLAGIDTTKEPERHAER